MLREPFLHKQKKGKLSTLLTLNYSNQLTRLIIYCLRGLRVPNREWWFTYYGRQRNLNWIMNGRTMEANR